MPNAPELRSAAWDRPFRIQSFMLSLHDRPIVERTFKTVKSQARSQAGARLEELAVEVNPLPIQAPNPIKCGEILRSR